MARSILQRIAEGDKVAVKECIDTYGGLIWSIARKMLNSNGDIEDVVQESFISLWKSADRFDPALASETTFVAMIARRRAIEKVRSAARSADVRSLDELQLDPEERSDKKLLVSIEAQDAARAFNVLKPEQRQVLQLSILQGMSQTEISDATGMPLGTVKTHARRGLIELRKAVGVEENEYRRAQYE